MKTKDTTEHIKKLTYLFVGFIIVFTFTCISILISNYDSLARYPYEDQNGRALIKEHMNRDEIEYIIENAIGPNKFIQFIDADRFDIKHCDDYKMLSKVRWDLTPQEVVDIVEETRDLIPTKKLVRYINDGNYNLDEVLDFEYHKNSYFENAKLIVDAKKPDVFIEKNQTLYKRFPKNLVHLDPMIPTTRKDLLIDKRMQKPLSDLLTAMNKDLYGEDGKSLLKVDRTYISYEQQQKLYDEALAKYGKDKVLEYEFYPGCSEHQLGLALDFIIPGLLEESFNKTAEAKWLKEHASEYGFIQTYTANSEPYTNMKAKPYHYRYIGLDMAKTLKDTGQSLAEYKYKPHTSNQEKAANKKVKVEDDEEKDQSE